jgi:hypothetical protein
LGHTHEQGLVVSVCAIKRPHIASMLWEMPNKDSKLNQLKQGIQIARKAMSSSGWNGFKKMHELGVFIRHFPEHARNMCDLNSLF